MNTNQHSTGGAGMYLTRETLDRIAVVIICVSIVWIAVSVGRVIS